MNITAYLKACCTIFVFFSSLLSLAQNPTPLGQSYINAIKACGAQSPNTVPDDWAPVIVRGGAPGSAICEAFLPPFWQNSYMGDSGTLIYEPSGLNGSTFLRGTPFGLQECSPRGYAGWYLSLIAKSGCGDPKLEFYNQGVMDVYQTATFVYSCNKAGVQLVGGAFIGTQQSVLCSTFALGHWQSQADIGQKTCIATQVTSSHKCANPQGQLCEKPTCSKSCKAQGYINGGYCNSFEQCQCNNN